MQQLVIVQIVDLFGAAVFLEIGGGGDHAFGRLGQLASPQGAVFQLSDTDGHIETFADQFDVAVVQHHVDGDIGEIGEEFGQGGRQMVHAKVSRDRDPQKARGRGLHRGHKRVGFARVIQHAAGTVVIGKPDLCRTDAAGRAVQQPRPKPCFKRGYVFGYGGFGDTHLLGRIGKATLVHDRGECFHLCQAVHTRPLSSSASGKGMAAKSGRITAAVRQWRGIYRDRSRRGNRARRAVAKSSGPVSGPETSAAPAPPCRDRGW